MYSLIAASHSAHITVLCVFSGRFQSVSVKSTTHKGAGWQGGRKGAGWQRGLLPVARVASYAFSAAAGCCQSNLGNSNGISQALAHTHPSQPKLAMWPLEISFVYISNSALNISIQFCNICNYFPCKCA